MTVYIISQGERGEGGYILEIHQSFEKAKESFKGFAPTDDGWKVNESGDYAHNGCDWIDIAPQEVIPS